MGLQKTAVSALNLLIDIGYFPVHVNLDLLKLNLPTDHSDAIVEAAEILLSESSDLDAVSTLSCIWICLLYCRMLVVISQSVDIHSPRFNILTFSNLV